MKVTDLTTITITITDMIIQESPLHNYYNYKGSLSTANSQLSLAISFVVGPLFSCTVLYGCRCCRFPADDGGVNGGADGGALVLVRTLLSKGAHDFVIVH